MKNFELYCGLKKRRGEYGDSISTAEKEISRLELEKAELESSFARTEALGGAVDSIQKRIKTNADAILASQAAVDKARKAIDTLEKEKVRVRPAAFEEIRAEYRGRFEKGLRFFLRKLEEAADAELEFIKIRTEAIRTAAQIDVDEMRCGLPIIDHVVVDRGEGNGSLIAQFLRDCRAQGLPLDD